MMWVADHLEHRQFGDRRQGVGVEIERAGSGPGALELDVLQIIFDQLANAWTAARMGMILSRKLGAASEASTAAGSAALCL
jgi:hypothetical protein